MARYLNAPQTCLKCGQVIPAGSRAKNAFQGVTHQGACPSALPQYSERQIVLAGSVEVGQTVRGLRVVSLGKSWFCGNEDNSAYGVEPSRDARVQYAYLSEV